MLSVPLLALGCPTLAYCSAEDHSSISSLVPFWVNFAIYLAVLFVALRKIIPQAWMARRNAILENVTSAARELEQAEKAVRNAEDKTKNLASEQEAARQEIIKQAELEAVQIITAAKEKAERQKAQAKELIQGESRSAESTFRTELVFRAVELAREKFKSGAYSAKESDYRSAALDRAKRLVQ
jgi:F0F1-type ATP synthase membrane subunit b/b'